MLHRVIGRAGSGKTTYLLAVLREALQNGADCIVLVPEQQSLETERLLSETLGDGYNMHCEVLNFERLPNRVAREYGGSGSLRSLPNTAASAPTATSSARRCRPLPR